MIVLLFFPLINMISEKVSENLKDGKSVFSGTGMPDMPDSAWLAITVQAVTPKSETIDRSTVR